MFARMMLLVIAVLALAFAPAPLPRKERSKSGVLTMARVSGTWIVQSVKTSTKGGYTGTSDRLAQVRIENGHWSFCDAQGVPSRTSEIQVDGMQSPATFDLLERGRVETAGIIRLRGDELQVLYQWGRPRPASFEIPPDGYWLITFKRQ